jgi:Putative polyhydroxyalkanoic acid system protein (PHA_gran_rgn)
MFAMSAPLTVSIPHSLGREEAARRLKSGLARATAGVPMVKIEHERWDGDRLDLRVRAMGQVASGNVDVLDDRVNVEVTLPWLLQRFADIAQATIKSRGKLLLEKK